MAAASPMWADDLNGTFEEQLKQLGVRGRLVHGSERPDPRAEV